MRSPPTTTVKRGEQINKNTQNQAPAFKIIIPRRPVSSLIANYVVPRAVFSAFFYFSLLFSFWQTYPGIFPPPLLLQKQTRIIIMNRKIKNIFYYYGTRAVINITRYTRQNRAAAHTSGLTAAAAAAHT